MTAELTMDKLCTVIEDGIKAANHAEGLTEEVTEASRMGSPREWDSLSFVAVYNAVSEAFDVELDYDDAIHFRDVKSIHGFLEEVIAA